MYRIIHDFKTDQSKDSIESIKNKILGAVLKFNKINKSLEVNRYLIYLMTTANYNRN